MPVAAIGVVKSAFGTSCFNTGPAVFTSTAMSLRPFTTFAGRAVSFASGERVDHSHLTIFLSRIQILGVNRVSAERFRGCKNRPVPIGNRVTLRYFNRDPHQPMVHGLTGKRHPLLDPLEGLCSRERPGGLPGDGDEEFLKNLRRRSKLFCVHQAERNFALPFILARSDGRVNQDIRIEEDTSGHAVRPGSSSFCRAGPPTVCSTD